MTTKGITLTALREKIEAKLRFAREDGATLDAAKTYESILRDLECLELSSAPLDQVYTTEEAAERLKVTAQTVTKYCRAGLFQAPPGATFASAYRTNGDSGPWRIPAPALVYFINQRPETDPVAGAERDGFEDFEPFLKAG